MRMVMVTDLIHHVGRRHQRGIDAEGFHGSQAPLEIAHTKGGVSRRYRPPFCDAVRGRGRGGVLMRMGAIVIDH